ncbi:response regulator [Deferribacter autotrophicus]|uniref:histidine kinase n=1 Tax=Deferribacter autotrophicus TaxID=500465 RepID=A0A5A8F168_9BACT|nr:response regulator [Deferribacter autotrophicus]KAA0257086.1 response regulator [Deferribacter autotrophicus]
MTFRKKNIVAIDDEESVLINLEKKLNKFIECNFYGFKNSDEALNFIRENHVDLILLDLLMPEKSGFEVLSEIKDDENLKRIPVIILTVKADAEAIDEAFERGADDYILKSSYENELLARVKRILRTKEMEEELLNYERDKVALQLGGGIAHHFNQPLTVLTMGFEIIRTLLETQHPEALKTIDKYLKMCEDSAERISKIVDKLSSLKKYSIMKYVGDMHIFDLSLDNED